MKIWSGVDLASLIVSQVVSHNFVRALFGGEATVRGLFQLEDVISNDLYEIQLAN